MATFESPLSGLAWLANYAYRDSGLNFYAILLNNSASLSKSTSTIIDVLSLEPLTSTGYSRQLLSLNFAPATDKVTATASPSFTANSTSTIQFDRIMILGDGKAIANSEVASISSDTINSTAHGLTDGDKVFFTNVSNSFPSGISDNTIYYVVNAATNSFQIASTLGGSALSLGTTYSGILVARCANGQLMPWLLLDPDTGGNRTITIQPSQSQPFTLSLSYA